MEDDTKYDYIQGDNEEARFRSVSYLNNKTFEIVDACIYADKTVEIEYLVYEIPTKPEDVGAQPVGSYLESTELTTAINTALAQAKESGEFDGADGHTPVKGTDYWTAADKQEIVNSVIAALPDGTKR